MSRRLSELQKEAKSEKVALHLERKIRAQAQGDLQRVGAQLFEEANLRDLAVGEQRQMKEEIHSEKAALTIAKQELQAAYQEGRLLYTKSEKQEENINKLLEDNKATKKKVVDLEAERIAGTSANFQKQFQQQTDQKAVVEALEARVEEMAGLVQNLTSQSEPLTKQNAILTQDLSSI